MTIPTVVARKPLGMPWETIDPFLFCVYHEDCYPRGNALLGPDDSLAGRQLGNDFSGKDGWRMYHGTTVPGFPSHPHRGFETVTIVRLGRIDHSDSLGATARFGGGDVQWLTTGSGIVHAEMFPLLDRVERNPLELFQIWLNLPARSKMVPAHFTMFWSEHIPHRRFIDTNGGSTDVTCIAGSLQPQGLAAPLAPPPDSWASQPESDLAIWTMKMAPGARWTLPAAAGSTTRRCLYFFKGDSVTIDGESVQEHVALELNAGTDAEMVNGGTASEFLLLQGRPIGEAVAQYGPFVMNTRAELEQAFADYQRTHFGGWPWPDAAPVHDQTQGRFARHADGRVETAPSVAG
ncbi:MAG: pirin family protein [Pseudomonadota bacterium]